jgi:hypothetical protein
MALYFHSSYERDEARWDRAYRVVNGLGILALIFALVCLAVRAF